MAFFAWQNQRDRQAQAEAAAMEQMRLQAALQQKGLDTAELNKAQTIINAFRDSFIANLPPEVRNTPQAQEQATQQARVAYANYIASSPEAITAENRATSALSRNKEGYFTGQRNLAPISGAEDIQALIDAARERQTTSGLNINRALGQMQTSPEAAKAGDIANTAVSNLLSAKTSAMIPSAPLLGQTEVARDITGNKYQQELTMGQDPAKAAAAINARNAMTSALGGIQPPTAGVDPMSELYTAIQQIMSQRMNNQAPVTTSALPVRTNNVPVIPIPSQTMTRRNVLTIDQLR